MLLLLYNKEKRRNRRWREVNLDEQTVKTAPKLILCETCRAEFREGARFCPNCGASAAQQSKPLIATGERRKRLKRRKLICAVAAAAAVVAAAALWLLLN